MVLANDASAWDIGHFPPSCGATRYGNGGPATLCQQGLERVPEHPHATPWSPSVEPAKATLPLRRFAPSSADNADLQELLRRALPPSGARGAAGSMTVRRPAGLPPLALHVTPVGGREREFRAWPVAALVPDIPLEDGLLDPGDLQADLRVDLGGAEFSSPVVEHRPSPVQLLPAPGDNDDFDPATALPQSLPEVAVRRTPRAERRHGLVARIDVDEDGAVGVQRDRQLLREVAPGAAGHSPVEPRGKQCPGGGPGRLDLAAHVERRELEEEPFPQLVPVLEGGRPQLLVHRVRPEPRVPPLGQPLEPINLRLLHPVRLLDGLIGEHLGHGGVDPALGQRGRDLRLLEGWCSPRRPAGCCRGTRRDASFGEPGSPRWPTR